MPDGVGLGGRGGGGQVDGLRVGLRRVRLGRALQRGRRLHRRGREEHHRDQRRKG